MDSSLLVDVDVDAMAGGQAVPWDLPFLPGHSLRTTIGGPPGSGVITATFAEAVADEAVVVNGAVPEVSRAMLAEGTDYWRRCVSSLVVCRHSGASLVGAGG